MPGCFSVLLFVRGWLALCYVQSCTLEINPTQEPLSKFRLPNNFMVRPVKPGERREEYLGSMHRIVETVSTARLAYLGQKSNLYFNQLPTMQVN